MKKKDKMKLLGIILLILIAVSVILTFLIVSRLCRQTEGEEEEKLTSVSGTLSDAYIAENSDGKIIILYHGQKYVAKETTETDYIGVADIELNEGKIVKIYAKSGSIEGVLDSYTEDSVQIKGYEAIPCETELPVYRVSDNSDSSDRVQEISISDLVIGNSKIELIVANERVCAIVYHNDEEVNNVRVLLKNGESVFYPNIYVKCSKKSKMNDKTLKAGKIISAKECLQDAKNGKEIRISPTGKGILYICNEKGQKQKEGYEGEFFIRKEADGYVLINEIAIEDYVRYVLPSEMPVSFSYEALKAQAVCARTFVYGQMKGKAYARYGANLDDTTAYQVYHEASTSDATDQAVYDTQGMVMTYNGSLVDCYYFSTSPGYSEDLKIWGKDSPGYICAENHTGEKKKDLSRKKTFHKYITSKPKSYDSDSPYYRWSATLSGKMGMDEKYGRLKKIRINDRSESGYVLSLTMIFEEGERTYENEYEMRIALGKYLTQIELADGSTRNDFHALPSACFEIKKQKKGTVVLTGGGFGHGIGMSQYGADGMGREGKDWKEILEYYYKGIEIVQK